LDEYQTTFGNTWQTKTTDSTDPWPYLPDALTKFQVCLFECSNSQVN
jgi:synaptobrevin family protein YKT6